MEPCPRSISNNWLSTSGFKSAVTVALTSLTGANADITRLNGATTDFALPLSSSHKVRIDSESLPTGIDTPSSGQNSIDTASTVSKRIGSGGNVGNGLSDCHST